jgi:hypothetical protein
VRLAIRRRLAGGRLRTVGTLRRRAKAGASRVVLGGRIGRRVLAPGRYEVALTATDAARNSSRAQRRAFTIRAPRRARGSARSTRR